MPVERLGTGCEGCDWRSRTKFDPPPDICVWLCRTGAPLAMCTAAAEALPWMLTIAVQTTSWEICRPNSLLNQFYKWMGSSLQASLTTTPSVVFNETFDDTIMHRRCPHPQ